MLMSRPRWTATVRSIKAIAYGAIRIPRNTYIPVNTEMAIKMNQRANRRGLYIGF